MPMVRPCGPLPAQIMIIGDAPGDMEITKGMPFVGYSGQELDRMLNDAGIMRSQCFITNVLRDKPPGGDPEVYITTKKKEVTAAHTSFNGKWVLPQFTQALEVLKQEIIMCRPNVIVAVGNIALFALTGEWGVNTWRGSELECTLDLPLDYHPRVIPIIHPAVILKRWDWRNLVVHDLRKVKRVSSFREINTPDNKFIIRPDYGQVAAVLTQLYNAVAKGPVKLSVDIETRAGHISCIGIAWSKTEALCIPLMCVDAGKEAGYWDETEEFQIIFLLQRLLTHKNAQIVGQNFLYDAQYFYRWLLFIPNLVRDTMLAQHSCFSNLPKGLDFLSSMYCEYHRYWKDERKEWNPKIPEEQHWAYNCKDAVITYEVDEVLQEVVDKLGLREVHDFQQSMFQPVLETMIRGIRADTSRRAQFAHTLIEEVAKREQYYIDVLGHPLNPRSTPQMQGLFYGDLKQKPITNRKTGALSTDDESLRKIADREPLLRPLCNKIAEHRSLGVFLSTFVNAPLDVDGRLRCSFNIAGTETYRFSSSQNAFGSGLNLQNIPKGGEDDQLSLPNVRTLFIPDHGYTFFDIDLDSADLRIVQREADIPEMGAMLAEGKKVYVEVMKEYYHDQTLTKHSPQYGTFKSFAHGTHYLGTAKGLAERLGLLVHEVDILQKWYFGKFPELRRWHEEIKNQVVKRRWIENVFGYRTYFFDRIEGTIFNQAIAWIPQSTVGCLINRGYRKIYDQHKHIQVLLQVHDSLAGQFPSHMGAVCPQEIKDACSVPLPYSVPMIIPVDIKTSDRSWGHCE